MADIETVKTRLGYLVDFGHESKQETVAEIASDAIALLKEQEPLKPNRMTSDNGFHYDFCGKCGRLLPVAQDFNRANYCPNCGRAVKWN